MRFSHAISMFMPPVLVTFGTTARVHVEVLSANCVHARVPVVMPYMQTLTDGVPALAFR